MDRRERPLAAVEIGGHGRLAVEVTALARSAGMVVRAPGPSIAPGRVDAVLELGTGSPERKRDLIAELSERAPADIPIAAFVPSSSVAEVAVGASAPERIVGVSMFASPLPAGVVEVAGHRGTAGWAVERVYEVWRRLGKAPVRCADRPGMIGNRLVFAYVNDAARFVRRTGLPPDLVDAAMRLGTGVPRGPFELARAVGPDVCLRALRTLYGRSGDPRLRPVPELAGLASSAAVAPLEGRHAAGEIPATGRTVPGGTWGDGMDARTIGVVGTGTMGGGIVAAAAGAGYDVVCVGRSRESLARVAGSVHRSAGRSRSRDARPGGSIRWSTALRDLRGCDLVIEAVVEERAVKEAVLAELGRNLSRKAVMATTTSSLSVHDLARASGRPGSFVGLHFFNPVAAMRLVELIHTSEVGERAVELAARFAESLGKTVVRAPDTPGFIVNRLLFPMVNDALSLVEDSSATPEEVDAVVEGSLGHPIGPIALADLVGLDVTERIVESLAAADPLLPGPSRLLRDLVRAGVLGRKSGRGAREEGWAERSPGRRKSGQERGRP